MKYSEIYNCIHYEEKKPDLTPSESIAWGIVRDLTDRRGFRGAWYDYDEDTRDEIFAEWVEIIDNPTELT